MQYSFTLLPPSFLPSPSISCLLGSHPRKKATAWKRMLETSLHNMSSVSLSPFLLTFQFPFHLSDMFTHSARPSESRFSLKRVTGEVGPEAKLLLYFWEAKWELKYDKREIGWTEPSPTTNLSMIYPFSFYSFLQILKCFKGVICRIYKVGWGAAEDRWLPSSLTQPIYSSNIVLKTASGHQIPCLCVSFINGQ